MWGGGLCEGGRALLSRWGLHRLGTSRKGSPQACLFSGLTQTLWAYFVFESVSHIITHSFMQFLKIYNLWKLSFGRVFHSPRLELLRKCFSVSSESLPFDYHVISLFNWWPFFSKTLIVSSASYAVLKNLNEPFYFFLLARTPHTQPTLQSSLWVRLINSGMVSEGPL